MRIVIAQPPNIVAVRTAFPAVAEMAVYFAWGDRIYNPAGVPVSASTMAHEMVHGRRQGADVEGWWSHYIADPAFRLEEEIPAHQAEYAKFCADHPGGAGRAARRVALHHIAGRMASRLYGNLIKYDDARRLIKGVSS